MVSTGTQPTAEGPITLDNGSTPETTTPGYTSQSDVPIDILIEAIELVRSRGSKDVLFGCPTELTQGTKSPIYSISFPIGSDESEVNRTFIEHGTLLQTKTEVPMNSLVKVDVIAQNTAEVIPRQDTVGRFVDPNKQVSWSWYIEPYTSEMITLDFAIKPIVNIRGDQTEFIYSSASIPFLQVNKSRMFSLKLIWNEFGGIIVGAVVITFGFLIRDVIKRKSERKNAQDANRTNKKYVAE